MSSPQAPAPKPLGTTEWLICFIAVIGFAFDPNFRAYLDGMNVLFLNAVFRAPAHSR